MAKYKIYDFTAKTYEVTQVYGANVQLYKDLTKDPKTGKSTLNNGHEGVDFGTPTGTEGLAPFDGIIVRDEIDQPGWKNYGIYTTIWDPIQNIALWFCHLKDFTTKAGDHVKRGDVIFHTNNTGNTSGEHCHVNFCETDANGMRLNQDNGSLGFLNLLDSKLVQILPIPVAKPDPGLVTAVAQGTAQEVNKQSTPTSPILPTSPTDTTKDITFTLAIPLEDSPADYMGIKRSEFKAMHDKADLYDPLNTAGYSSITDVDKMKQTMLDEVASVKSDYQQKLIEAERQHETDFLAIQGFKEELLRANQDAKISDEAHIDQLDKSSATIQHSIDLGNKVKQLENDMKSLISASGIPTTKTKTIHGIVSYFSKLHDDAVSSIQNKPKAAIKTVVNNKSSIMQKLGLSFLSFIGIITFGVFVRR